MKLSIVTRPKAAAEIEAAYNWYERERPGLGEEFLVALNHAVAIIAGHPERFPIVHRDTRRVLLLRFPYSICYRLNVDISSCSLFPLEAKSIGMEVS